MIKTLEHSNVSLWKKFYSSFSSVDREEIERELDNNPFIHYLVYQKEDMVIAFLNYSIIYDRMEINQIEVLKDYRRNNIGSILIEELIRIAHNKHYQNITLEVKCDNIAALNLYKKFGFVEKAKRLGYYNGVDGILMEKEMVEWKIFIY